MEECINSDEPFRFLSDSEMVGLTVFLTAQRLVYLHAHLLQQHTWTCNIRRTYRPQRHPSHYRCKNQRTSNHGIINFFPFLHAFNHSLHGFALWITSVWSLLLVFNKSCPEGGVEGHCIDQYGLCKTGCKKILQNPFKRTELCDFQWVKVSHTYVDHIKQC